MAKQPQVSDKEKKEQDDLHQKVVKALNEIGADVKAAPQVFVDKEGNLKVNAIPFVTKKVDEEPSNDASGDSPVEDGAASPKAE